MGGCSPRIGARMAEIVTSGMTRVPAVVREAHLPAAARAGR